MRRILLITVVATVVGGATVASAASLGLSSSTLAAGSDTVTRCQTAPPEVSLVIEDDEVVASIDELADGCDGSDLRLVLLDGDDVLLATGGLAPVPVDRPFDVPTDLHPDDVGTVASVHIALAGRP